MTPHPGVSDPTGTDSWRVKCFHADASRDTTTSWVSEHPLVEWRAVQSEPSQEPTLGVIISEDELDSRRISRDLTGLSCRFACRFPSKWNSSKG